MTGTRVVVDEDDVGGWVDRLGDPVRAKDAFWSLLGRGRVALPAIRAGLAHAHADVRMHCAKLLDHLVDDEAFPELVAMLADPDPRVRVETLHALACERCKENGCRPAKEAVLPRALALLTDDPSPHVRARACEVVGRWAHTDAVAAAALAAAHEDDPSPAVRKKAGWFAPGGVIYGRTHPRNPR